MSEDWYSAGITGDTWGNTRRETLVRAWAPGDGVHCSNARLASRGKYPCDIPVAVVKEVLLSKPQHKTERASVTRVLCLRHLARHFDTEVAVAADRAVEQKALEELAQRYWDQYQVIRERMQRELFEERFSALPNGLRERVIELLEKGSDAA